MTRYDTLLKLAASMLVLSSCSQRHSIDAVKKAGTPVALRHATRFEIRRDGDLKIVTVKRPWRGATRDFTYLLHPRGTTPPDYAGVDATIPYPVERAVLTSTTSAVYFNKLSALDAVAGMTNPGLANTPAVVERIKSGKITDVGGSMGLSADLDHERLVALAPDVAIAHATGSAEHDVLPQLRELGISVVMNASYMEETPLGRTEWIRFYGAFLDKEEEAERIFAQIESEYDALKVKVATVETRPTVLCNIAFKGEWNLPGGRSYMAKFIADAGGDYPWSDNMDSGGFPADLEEILVKASDTDFWLNPGGYKSLNEIKAVDSRYALFRPFKTGQVYNHTKRVNAGGGQDYWERGAANPHHVLADIISILHPSLLPEHETVWYEKLPEVRDAGK